VFGDGVCAEVGSWVGDCNWLKCCAVVSGVIVMAICGVVGWDGAGGLVKKCHSIGLHCR